MCGRASAVSRRRAFRPCPRWSKLSGGLNVVITESDLLDYAGMDLTADTEPNSLRGLFPRYPAKVQLKRDRDEEVVERAEYIAKTLAEYAISRGACWRLPPRIVG